MKQCGLVTSNTSIEKAGQDSKQRRGGRKKSGKRKGKHNTVQTFQMHL